MRFILTATLLFFAQPSYAETQPNYARFAFEKDKHCEWIAWQADLWVTEAQEAITEAIEQPTGQLREHLEEARQHMTFANDFAGVYSAFCK